MLPGMLDHVIATHFPAIAASPPSTGQSAAGHREQMYLDFFREARLREEVKAGCGGWGAKARGAAAPAATAAVKRR